MASTPTVTVDSQVPQENSSPIAFRQLTRFSFRRKNKKPITEDQVNQLRLDDIKMLRYTALVR